MLPSIKSLRHTSFCLSESLFEKRLNENLLMYHRVYLNTFEYLDISPIDYSSSLCNDEYLYIYIPSEVDISHILLVEAFFTYSRG